MSHIRASLLFLSILGLCDANASNLIPSGEYTITSADGSSTVMPGHTWKIRNLPSVACKPNKLCSAIEINGSFSVGTGDVRKGKFNLLAQQVGDEALWINEGSKVKVIAPNISVEVQDFIENLSSRPSQTQAEEYTSQAASTPEPVQQAQPAYKIDKWPIFAKSNLRSFLNVNQQPIATSIQSITHPTGSNATMEGVNILDQSDGMLIEMTVGWSGWGGNRYHTVIQWEISKWANGSVRVSSDTAQYAVAGPNLIQLGQYFQNQIYPNFSNQMERTRNLWAPK